MQQTTGTNAVASLVLGIIALVTLLTAGIWWGCLPLPLILGILAWIFGKNAMNAIDAGIGNPNERGMAVAGSSWASSLLCYPCWGCAALAARLQALSG